MKKQPLFLLVLLLIIIPALYAVPAIPYPVTFSQPNGDTLTVRIIGDERIHWRESMDGYTLMFNQYGYLSYAQLDIYGNLQPSDFMATNIEERNNITLSFLNTIEKHLFYSDIQRQLMLKVWEIEDDFIDKSESKAVIGHYKTLCAFVQFPEKSMTRPMSDFEGLMNQLGYTTNGTGSVRDYFRESSYEQFDLTITLCGVYTAPSSQAYYAGNSGTQRVRELARWLAQQVAAEPDINFSDYDSNNNGFVDGFHFIFAGRGQEAGGGSEAIWSHKSQFSSPVTQNGKSISVYSCSPELYQTGITTIGVICHEMSHAFGAPDFYDTNGSTGGSFTGTGNWDIMAGGSWNGSPGGNRPPHHNMYSKIKFGWVTPTVLSTPLTIVNMPNSAENPVAYRINTATTNEYFLLENRQRLKFDTNVPGSGLLIYRVHAQIASAENNNTINTTHPQRMYPVCASATVAMPNSTPSSYGNINSGGCPFPGSSNQDSFTDDTTPSMKSWANTNTGKPITKIIQMNGRINFYFMGGGDVDYYLITFDANGGIGSMALQLFLSDDTYPLNANTFIKQGYTFASWNTSPDGTGTSYTNQQSVMFSDDMTLYAQWQPATYTLTLDPDGGTVSPTSIPVTYGAPIGELPMPVRPGYDFIDWRILATTITEETVWYHTQNRTAQARWELSTGIVETWCATFLQIVPNPANHTVELRIRIAGQARNDSESGINQIEFYNMFGQLVKSVPFSGQTITDGVSQRINISDLSAGVYMIKTGDKIVKLIKSNSINN